MNRIHTEAAGRTSSSGTTPIFCTHEAPDRIYPRNWAIEPVNLDPINEIL